MSLVENAILRTLRETGLSFVGLVAPQRLAEINAHLLGCPVFRDAHVAQTARNRGEGTLPRSMAANSECVCVSTHDVVLAPHLLEGALALTDVAATYLDHEPPVLYSANAFWTRPGNAERPDIQHFHRDQDDTRFLAMFVYLTPVLGDDGVHDLVGPDGAVHTMRGPAGTIFLADTSNLHRGRKPKAAERGIAWFRWGVSERPAANVWDGIEPIPRAYLGERYPSEARLQQSIRLLVS